MKRLLLALVPAVVPFDVDVTLELRRPDGSVPESAVVSVEYEDASQGTFIEWSKDQTTVTLPGAPLRAVVYADLLELKDGTPTDSRLISEPLSLSPVPEAGSAIQVELAPRQVLEIDVVRPRPGSARGRGVVVAVVPHVDESPRVLRRNLQMVVRDRARNKWQDLPKSGETRFQFDLAPGNYCVGCFSNIITLETVEEIVVGEGRTVARLELSDPEAAGEVTIRAVDEHGQPVQILAMSLVIERKRSSTHHGGVTARTGDTGVKRIWRSFLDPPRSASQVADDPVKSIELMVNAGGLGQRSVFIVPDKDEYVVRFGPPMRVQLRPIGAVGDDLYMRIRRGDHPSSTTYAAAEVVLDLVQDPVLFIEWVRAETVMRLPFVEDAPQRFSIDGLPLGVQRIELDGSGLYNVAAPEPRALTVDASEFAPGTRLLLYRIPGREELKPLEDGLLRAGVDAAGRAEFKGLSDGRYRVRAQGWWEPVSVDVAGELTKITYEPVPVLALRVHLDDAIGGLAGCGLRPDDRIVGRDGERFVTGEQLGALLSDMYKDPLEVVVDRRGELLEVELGPFASQDKLGGMLVPAYQND